MRARFNYRQCKGFVIWPPDDYTYESAMQFVKKDVDRLIRNYGRNMPRKNTGSHQQIIWRYRYVQETRKSD